MPVRYKPFNGYTWGYVPQTPSIGGSSLFLREDGTWQLPGGIGGGDVTGPAGAVANNVAIFNGATGKVIKDSGLALAGTNTGDQTISLTGNVTGSGTGSFATTIAPGVVTLAMQANMATASVVYRKTAGAGVPEVQTLATLKSDLGLTGTNSGDQTIALTGDVTGSGTGSFAATIAAGAVSLAKMANLAANSILGNNTGAPATPIALTAAQVKTLLAITATDVGLGSVTNDAQTKAAIVPNTAPAAGQILVGNAGGTAYAPVTAGGDVTMTSAGAYTVTKINGTSLAGLATGLLKNTTTTGVPSIAVAGTDYLAPSSVAATVTAGTAAQGQGALTSDINVITTTGTIPGGVTLPTATLGRRVTVINKGTGIVNLYPASGASIDAAGLNLPLNLAVGGMLEFVASSTTQWYSSQNTSYVLPWGLAHLRQSTIATSAVAFTLTGAQITQSILQYTGAAGAVTWPTGTNIDAVLQSNFPVDMAFDYYVINTGSGTATMTTAAGLTLVGSMTVALGTSGHFRIRKTAANTFTIYRLS